MLSVNFNPFPLLITERLQLRQITDNDAHEIFLLRSDPRVMRYLDRPVARTNEDAMELIQRIRDSLEKNEGITWGIGLKTHNVLIGTIGYWKIIKEHHRAEIGYLLQHEHQGKGLMQEPEQYYGLGTISGSLNGWDFFGHTGGLQGYISRTCVFPSQGLTVCVLTNALDGWAHPWVDGIANILQAFAQEGAPTRKVRDWSGRWWSMWGALDLVPIGNKVLALAPGLINPMTNAPELSITSRTAGRIALAPGFGSHGEPVRCVRAKSGRITELHLAGTKFLPADKVAREIEARYDAAKPRKRKRKGR